MILRHISLILFTAISTLTFGQKFGFNQVLESAPDKPTVFCIPNHEDNVNLLNREEITIKFASENWLFITATPRWIDNHKRDQSLDDYYFEYAPPAVLSDSARAFHNVDEVHAGQAPLNIPYTGEDVIIGVVDQGIDWTHPDFINASGNTRVLRYWDQANSGANPAPTPYGYGQAWTNIEIDAGSCTSTEEASAHGTSVAGQAAGNGLANGSNMGMAPDAKLIIVESDFTATNWTLTVADAVDYIFKVADSLNMPAVANLSLGTYIGSHDGTDPAAEMMEALLDEHGGRIIVAAAGNGGKKGKFHCQHTVSANDTNFVWFKNNPSAAIAPNTIFFDLWSDQSDATWNFAIGADNPSYDFRGATNFHAASGQIGTPIYDTIWNGSNRIATIEAYTEVVNGSYHLQLFMSNVDSVDYLYRFMTVGSGNWDLWTGEWLGYNDMETSLPTVAQMPDILDYIMPDSLQSIVSSWNCSEKVISVGNMKNRHNHIDNNNNLYTNIHPNVPGELSPNSSKGPTRHNLTKPNVTASGDVSLSAGPMWLLTNPAYNAVIDSGGMHVRNGGTSMASPVVAGIAALYLDRCERANYQNFMTDIQNTAYTDQFTGMVPNNAYGYGKPDAFALLQELSLFSPAPTISLGSGTTLSSTAADGYQWYLNGNLLSGENNQDHNAVAPFGSYEVEVWNTDGCTAISTPFVASVGLESIGIDQINVYPNPASSQISFASNATILQVTLVDINGKTTLLRHLGNGNYDVSSISNGTYTLIVKTEKGTAHSKFVHL